MSESAKETTTTTTTVPMFERDPLNEKGRNPTADAKAAGEGSSTPQASGGRGKMEEAQRIGMGNVASNR